MNKRQKLFIIGFLSKLALVGTLYFGFWIIYELVWWNKNLIWALMSSGTNMVLAPLCFVLWVVFDMWLKDETTMPKFKLEKGSTQTEEKTTKETKPKKKEEKEEKLPIY